MLSSKSQIARKGTFSLHMPSFRFEKEKDKEKENESSAQVLQQKGIPAPSGTENRQPEGQPRAKDIKDKDKKADEDLDTMGKETRKPRLGLLTSLLPMLTSRSDLRTYPEVHRKPVPSATADVPLASPTNTTTSASFTATTRTSEDSKSSSRFDSTTGFTPLSPIEQDSLFLENGLFDSPDSAPGPTKLQKIPAMPLGPPPPPPSVLTKPGTPPRVPTVKAVQATPPTGRRPSTRSPSPERPPSSAKLQPHRLQSRHASPSPNPRGRSVSAQPPTVRNASVDGFRTVSSPVNHRRSQSKQSSEGSPTGATDRRKARRSWFPGGRSRANSDSGKSKAAYKAWVMAPDSQVDYNTALLVNGEKVPELWNESGNVYVYLHPKESGRGPSFKVADHMFSPSAVLNELLVTEMMATASHGAHYLDVVPASDGVSEGHLYLPLGNTDLERLVAARNLFAFLTHQPLVGTTENPTLFTAILQIAGLLRRFNFSSYDGSSFGEPVDAAFDILLDHTGLADVRYSLDKTLEALILAEQIKSWNLYNEAFVHAVGKYEALIDLKSPLYDRISVKTRKRLERAHLDLVNRQANVHTRLESFEFPSLFAGIASSTSTDEYKNVKYKEWRNSFGKMRSFVLGYYKDKFGNWPPRAKNKKNRFSQSGLNRLCLMTLYSDLCALYDLLVDRESLTPRVMGEAHDDSEDSKDKKKPAVDPSISALRAMLSEFEKSSPPVLPPIPFDIPKIPSMTTIYENYNELPAKKQAKYSKALQPHELQLLMIKSHNIDTDGLQLPFLVAFKEYELKEARGVHPHDLPDQRFGNWLFLYVVLQSLPMLVVDAPGLRYTEDVEDFLCEAPQGNAPWTEEAGEVRKMWYQTADQNIVELSADVVMFSVEGIYMRSHCWLAAKEWEASGPLAAPPPPPVVDITTSLEPPRAVFRDMDPFATNQSPLQQPLQQQQSRPMSMAFAMGAGRSAPNSPHLRPRSGSVNDRARAAFRTSIAIGLEPLPLSEAGMLDRRASRVPSVASSGGTGGDSGSGSSGEVYQQGGIRASRSAVNLSQISNGGFGVGNEFLPHHPRKPSHGGSGMLGPPIGGGGAGNGSGFVPGHGASESLGGSTFDDILKGMDKGKKKKKNLFF